MARRTFMEWAAERTRPSTLIASGQDVDLGNIDAIQSALNRRQEWQRQATDAYDACPELHFGVDYLAGLTSRLTFFAAELPDTQRGEAVLTVNQEPVQTKEQDVIDTLARLGSPIERAIIQSDIARQFLLPGEAYLIGMQPSPTRPNKEEFWQVRSIFEIEHSGSTVQLRDAPNDNKPTPLNVKGDTWIRLWQSSPRYKSLATSHARAILDAIDELLWWDAAARAFARNRLANAGAVGIPQNLEVKAESDEEVNMSGADRFLKRFYNAAIAAIRDPGSSAAAVPIFYTYPPNDRGTSGLDYLRMDRPQDSLLEARVERCLQRISQGLNIPSEIISGIGQATHWGSGQISESVFRDHIEPLAVVIVNALTTAYLRPILKKLDIKNPDKYLIWYDHSNLVVRPDMSQAADQGYQLALISGAAWRRQRGFSELDEPDDAERKKILETLQITRGRIPPGGSNPDINPIAQEGPQDPNAPPDEPQRPGARAAKPNQPSVAGKGRNALPDTKLRAVKASGNGSDDLLVTLAMQLQVLGDEKIRRALEHANAKLKSRAINNPRYKNLLRNVPNDQIASVLGREAVTKLGIDDLFDGSFDTVPTQFGLYCSRLRLEASSAQKRQFTETLRECAASKLFEPMTFEPLVTLTSILEWMGVENLVTEPVPV